MDGQEVMNCYVACALMTFHLKTITKIIFQYFTKILVYNWCLSKGTEILKMMLLFFHIYLKEQF